MKKNQIKRFVSLSLAIGMLTVGLAGCAGNTQPAPNVSSSSASSTTPDPATPAAPTETQFPITGEKLTLTCSVTGFTDVRPPIQDVWIWQEYEKKSNIHIEWEEIPRAQWAEKRSVMMATNAYPDIMMTHQFSNDDIYKYGKQGIFMPLNDLIDRYSVGIKALFEEDITYKKMATSADGNIYSLPYISKSLNLNGIRWFVNKTWLDKLGLKVPTTLDEYKQTLIAFRDGDPNGNGKNDEWAFYDKAGSIPAMISLIGTSYGLGNRGWFAQENSHIDMGPDGKVRFIETSNEYKEVMRYLNDLYKEGLINPAMAADVPQAQWQAEAQQDIIGSFKHVNPAIIGANLENNFVGINALAGPNGTKQAIIGPELRNNGTFAITDKCKNPEEAFKWVDWLFTPEGSMFLNCGIEGVTYNMIDGMPQFVDEIRNYEGGAQLGAFQKMDNIYGGSRPTVNTPEDKYCALMGYNPKVYFGVDPEEIKTLMPPEVWPTDFAATEAEADELLILKVDINKFIKESNLKFITGTWNLEGDFDSFCSQLEKMGGKRYLEIRQAQYERYAAVK